MRIDNSQLSQQKTDVCLFRSNEDLGLGGINFIVELSSVITYTF